MRKRLCAILLSCFGLTSALSGCGNASSETGAEDIVLVDPVGVAVSYEAAAYRTLYDAKVYSALICPYTEEYDLDSGMQFDRYAALPGEEVKRGQTLIKTYTKSVEDQIKDMEESIASAEKSHREYLEDTEDALMYPAADERNWRGILENHAKEEPEDRQSPEHEEWQAEHSMYEASYRNALISLQMQEEALRQNVGMYDLESAYNKRLLERLKEDRDKATVLSGMDGVVTIMQLMQRYTYMPADVPMVAVSDLNRKVLKSDYINKSEINKAEDVYAVINGKRYEVEYEVMETEEYKRLNDENGKVYTTFYVQGSTDELEMGGYAAIVVIRKSKRDVLTVQLGAVTREEGNASVYVLNGEESVNTPVTTGMQDGYYVEILSGLNEGDKVLTDQAAKATDKKTTVRRGDISNKFSGMGYLFYPTQEWLTIPIEYGTAYFVEGKVNLNQQVREGEPLVSIRVVPDSVELARNERKLQRERERLAELEANNPADNKRAIEAKKESIAELEKLIAKMNRDFAVTEIKAPYDGIVTDAAWDFMGLKEGDLLQKDQQIVMFAKQDSNYILVEDENGLLTYGNEANIEYNGLDGRAITATGTVVSLNQASVSAKLFEQSVSNSQKGCALIKVSAEDIGSMAGSAEGYDGWWSRSRFKISVVTREMKNVLLVPKNAVTTISGANYVRVILDNGEVRYQSFVAGGSDSANYWVVEGLTEGMELCTE